MKTLGIDPRIWKQVVGRKKASPGLVALAASACTELLEENLKWVPYKSLADTERSATAAQCGTPPMQIRNAMVAWVMAQKDAAVALESLAIWDRRLATWCACAVAETVLKYVPDDEDRPHIAIKTTRRWVLGDASDKKVGDAAIEVNDAGDEAYTEEAYGGAPNAAYDAINSVQYATYLPLESNPVYVRNSAGFVAVAAAISVTGRPKRSAEVKRELLRLREVVAQAIRTYPTGDLVASSRGFASSRTFAAGALGIAIGAGAAYAARSR